MLLGKGHEDADLCLAIHIGQGDDCKNDGRCDCEDHDYRADHVCQAADEHGDRVAQTSVQSLSIPSNK